MMDSIIATEELFHWTCRAYYSIYVSPLIFTVSFSSYIDNSSWITRSHGDPGICLRCSSSVPGPLSILTVIGKSAVIKNSWTCRRLLVGIFVDPRVFLYTPSLRTCAVKCAFGRPSLPLPHGFYGRSRDRTMQTSSNGDSKVRVENRRAEHPQFALQSKGQPSPGDAGSTSFQMVVKDTLDEIRFRVGKKAWITKPGIRYGIDSGETIFSHQPGEMKVFGAIENKP